jgi:DNA-binding MarR family transcriptional regulator/ribosomal protein S18 acetylase RimI-like enzyme
MASMSLQEKIQAVRRFNRFYTRRIGVLTNHLLESQFSLTEARVLYELAHHQETTASELLKDLDVDSGYLSRILASFERSRLLRRKKSEQDGRRRVLSLTRQGRRAFAMIDRRSNQEMKKLLEALSGQEQDELLQAIQVIETILGGRARPPTLCVLRPHRPGDIGYIIQRHGVLYAREYGLSEAFEAHVARALARFLANYDPQRERLWIAEVAGKPVGSAAIENAGRGVAQLRMLLVEPHARGMGVGRALLDECTSFATLKGYRKVTLFTLNILAAARRLYLQAGFRLVREQPHHNWGRDLVGQTWERSLKTAKARPAGRSRREKKE